MLKPRLHFLRGPANAMPSQLDPHGKGALRLKFVHGGLPEAGYLEDLS
jgi:hypothetical protein